MGKRREPRRLMQVEVRIFGTDIKGHIFSEKVMTADISRGGARLTGVKALLKVDETIGLACGTNKSSFRIRWIGTRGSPAEGQIGLLNLTPEKPLWGVPLAEPFLDDFRENADRDRRKSPRISCDIPVELRLPGAAPLRATASDLSAGGCFVEIPMTLQLDSSLEVLLWLSGTKLRFQGSVASSAPGFGIGVRFLNLAPQDHDLLTRFVQVHLQEVPSPQL